MVRRVEVVDWAQACIKKSDYWRQSKKVTFEKRREEVCETNGNLRVESS